MKFTSSGRGTVESQVSCVLYDPKSGQIRHVHTVVTMTGGERSTQAQVEKRAYALAKGVIANSAKLKALHVDPATVQAGRRYRVDVKLRALVEDHSASR